jgi:tetratricopeptide (TPR) repeat protein
LLLAARLGPERVAAEPGAVAELVGRCGYLPLALAVMAARAAADPDLPLGVLAAQLARTPDAVAQRSSGAGPGQLEVLDTGDPATSLSELLSWSHRQLSETAMTVFALLGLHCGPDITVPAAASLASVSRPDARRALAELADASLTAEHRPGRYVMHDLVRGYAAAQARRTLSEADICAAIDRSLDHYLHTMAAWSDIPRSFKPGPPAAGVVPERLAGEAQQVDWAQAEHQVLLRAIAQAAATGRATRAWQIFERQSWFLGDQGYWADCQAAGQAVMAAGQAAGDHAALGWAQMIIGRHCTFAGALDDGRAYLRRAQDHLSQVGDLRGQVSALLLSSYACGWKGDWAEGATLAGQALALQREAGHRGRWALYAIGECHAHLGNYDLARGYARQALELGPDPGDPTSLALAWGVLGFVHYRLGERHHAVSCYREALVLAIQWETPLARRWLAGLLADFGDACQAAGDLPAARKAWQQARQTLHDLGLPDSIGVRPSLHRVGPAG